MAFIPTNERLLFGQNLRQSLINLRNGVAAVNTLDAIITGMSNAQREAAFGVDPADTAAFVTAVGNLQTALAGASLQQALDDLGGV